VDCRFRTDERAARFSSTPCQNSKCNTTTIFQKNQKSKLKNQKSAQRKLHETFFGESSGHIVNVKNSKLVSLQPPGGFKRDDRVFQRGEGAIVTLLESTEALTTRNRHQIKSKQIKSKQFHIKCCAVTQT
jgi:hypothetical protein